MINHIFTLAGEKYNGMRGLSGEKLNYYDYIALYDNTNQNITKENSIWYYENALEYGVIFLSMLHKVTSL